MFYLKKHCLKRNFKNSRTVLLYIHYVLRNTRLGTVLFYRLKRTWTFIKSAFGVGTALYDLTAVSTFCTNAWLIAVCVIASTPIPTIIHKNFCKNQRYLRQYRSRFWLLSDLECALFCLWDKHIIRFCISDFKER